MILVTLLWSSAGVVTRHLDAARSFEVTFWRSAFNTVALAVAFGVMRGPAFWRGLMRAPWPVWASPWGHGTWCKTTWPAACWWRGSALWPMARAMGCCLRAMTRLRTPTPTTALLEWLRAQDAAPDARTMRA